ncbi:MAG: hypothetical protein V4560_09905 [Bacteroidota bacterium]
MKKIALISAIALSGLIYNTASAQISFGIHINTPAVRIVAETPVYAGYTAADDYYYLPEVDAYYSVAERCYYYNNGDNWVQAAYLPGEYRNYNWRNARYYEVRARRPYLHADIYRERYRGNTNNWGRNERVDNRSYANRDDHRNNDMRVERREGYRRPEQRDNRAWDGNRGNDRFDNRGSNNYNQPQQQDRGRGNNGRPMQQGRNDNRPQDQPSRQNNDGQQQRGNNSNDHFADNRGNAHNGFRS